MNPNETAQKPDSPEPWVDAQTAARHLGFAPHHIRNLAKEGRIPAVALGSGSHKFWRFKLSLLDACIQPDSNQAAAVKKK